VEFSSCSPEAQKTKRHLHIQFVVKGFLRRHRPRAACWKRNADSIQIQWRFFKGAGPATNEAFANHQIDFAAQVDLLPQ
jgi:hypothetical protein